jgi:hypothetical protein
VRHRILVSIALAAGITTAFCNAARAELGWLRLTMAGAAGYSDFDGSFQMKDDNGIPIEARAGVSIFRHFGIEGTYGKVLGRPFYPDRDSHGPLGRGPGGEHPPHLLINPYLIGGGRS